MTTTITTLTNKLMSAIVQQMPHGAARDILSSDLDLISEPGGFDCDCGISNISRQTYLKVAELALMLTQMEGKAELQTLRGAVRAMGRPTPRTGNGQYALERARANNSI